MLLLKKNKITSNLINFIIFVDNDCGDSSDEVISLCSNYNCTEENSRFRCKNGLCIYSNNVCNGFNDCADGSGNYNSSCLTKTLNKGFAHFALNFYFLEVISYKFFSKLGRIKYLNPTQFTDKSLIQSFLKVFTCFRIFYLDNSSFKIKLNQACGTYFDSLTYNFI